MKVNISGLHVDLGESLQKYVESNVQKVVQRYYKHPTSANIKFDKHGHMFHAEILVNDGTGTGERSLSKAACQGTDVYKTFDSCLNKLEKRLIKYKDKLRDLHRRRLEAERHAVAAIDYVIESDSAEVSEVEAAADNPVVIAEMPTAIERLSVRDAVMKLELMHLHALAFINNNSGRINFVCERPDGNISWLDPEAVKEKK